MKNNFIVLSYFYEDKEPIQSRELNEICAELLKDRLDREYSDYMHVVKEILDKMKD